MQLLENSVLGLRSARLTFARAKSALSITLFPMIHVGEADFFEKVYTDAFAHDVALVEGITSPIARRITRGYKWLIGPSSGLVVQPPYRSNAATKAEIIHSDLSADEFAEAWKKTPIGLRMLLNFAGPGFGLAHRWTLSREKLARQLSFDDLPSRDSILGWSPELGAIDEVLLRARDERLIDHIRDQIGKGSSKSHSISIVYGAAHMPPVLEEISRQGDFRLVSSDWLTVFRL
jgi:hypothetical protein